MAEHMTVCGGHLEADDTPNQIYRYIYIHQTKYTGIFVYTKPNIQVYLYTPNQIYRYIYIHQTKYTGIFIYTCMHTDTDA